MSLGKRDTLRFRYEIDGAATKSAAYLRIGGAQIAQPVMRQGLIMRLLLQRVRDTMRQTAKLAEQQGKDEQQTDGQGPAWAAL